MVWMILFVAAVGLTTVLAAATDLRDRRIPNYLTVPAAVLGLVYHAISPSGLGVGMALAGFGIGFALLLIPWLAGGGGMGDVKLLAALGAWLGPRFLLIAFCLSMVLGTVLLIAISLPRLFAGRWMKERHEALQTDHTKHEKTARSARRRRKSLPFALPMALGTWTFLAWFIARGGW